jgi:hypothetical protein
MGRKRTDKSWAACVGLVEIPDSKVRYECWNDLDIVDRKWPIHLRYLPNKWVTFDRDGAKLNLLWRRNCLKDWSLDKVKKPY